MKRKSVSLQKFKNASEAAVIRIESAETKLTTSRSGLKSHRNRSTRQRNKGVIEEMVLLDPGSGLRTVGCPRGPQPGGGSLHWPGAQQCGQHPPLRPLLLPPSASPSNQTGRVSLSSHHFRAQRELHRVVSLAAAWGWGNPTHVHEGDSAPWGKCGRKGRSTLMGPKTGRHLMSSPFQKDPVVHTVADTGMFAEA